MRSPSQGLAAGQARQMALPVLHVQPPLHCGRWAAAADVGGPGGEVTSPRAAAAQLSAGSSLQSPPAGQLPLVVTGRRGRRGRTPPTPTHLLHAARYADSCRGCVPAACSRRAPPSGAVLPPGGGARRAPTGAWRRSFTRDTMSRIEVYDASPYNAGLRCCRG